MYALDVDLQSRLMQAADDIESGWQIIGAEALKECEKARAAKVPIAFVYEAVGQAARGRAKETIRQYAWIVEKFGLDFLREFPQYSIDVWRAIASHARRNGGDVKALTLAITNGSAVTADAIRAKLRGDLDKPEPFIRAVRRMQAAAASVTRNARTDSERREASRIARVIDVFAANLDVE